MSNVGARLRENLWQVADLDIRHVSAQPESHQKPPNRKQSESDSWNFEGLRAVLPVAVEELVPATVEGHSFRVVACTPVAA